MKSPFLPLILVLLVAPILLIAAGGDLDLSFDDDGRLTTWFGGSPSLSGNDYGRGVAIQPDGKIIVVGISQNGNHDDFALARYQWADGALDTATDSDPAVVFGTGGKTRTNFNSCGLWSNSVDRAYAVLVNDGKILVGGTAETFDAGCERNSADFALARYNQSNGGLDTTFSGDGKLTRDIDLAVADGADEIHALAMQGTDKFIAAGFGTLGLETSMTLVRYNWSNGGFDSGFGTAVYSAADTTAANAILVLPDNRILAAGYQTAAAIDSFLLVRFTENGALDTTFNGDGVVDSISFGAGTSARVQAMTLDGQGRILLAGYRELAGDKDFAIARLDPATGNLDETFDGDSGTGNGLVTTNMGALDESAYAIHVGIDGRILVAGRSLNNFALIRYLPDGQLDTTLSGDGKLTTDFGIVDTAQGMAVRDHRILVVGLTKASLFDDYDFALARYLDDWRPNLNVELLTAGGVGVAPGTTVPIGVDLDSLGPEEAQNARLTLPLPAGVSFVSSDLAACTGIETISCNLGALSVGSTMTLILNVRPDVAGSYPLTATVSSDGLDMDPGNNTDSVILLATVTPPVCGNGTCEPGEDAASCPADCGGGGTEGCGNGSCAGDESCTSCPADCGNCPGPVCGNGLQEADEACDDGNTADGDSCSADCKQITTGGLVPDQNEEIRYQEFKHAKGGGGWGCGLH